jgi:hypothetical protein
MQPDVPRRIQGCRLASVGGTTLGEPDTIDGPDSLHSLSPLAVSRNGCRWTSAHSGRRFLPSAGPGAPDRSGRDVRIRAPITLRPAACDVSGKCRSSQWSPLADASTSVRSWVGRTARGVAARHRPTDADRREVVNISLIGLARCDDLGDLADRLAPLHPRNNTFRGEVLLDLAADAIELSGATRESPLEFERLREKHLPEAVAHTRAQHLKSKFALRAAAMVHGGVDPGLLDEVQWWRSDDLWYWSLGALAIYVRAAAARTGQSVESICRRIANEHEITLTGDDAP